ncbi:MAG: class I SAM-dependent methyltransferase [Candidatus Hermodarchaeota archaeon]|jgi:ubiquinone/menaquinone biosynthesis C-methylase UbiE|nr:class I SAM-dependent methyltransferase [Candidatus Hermodarchaeota archaeon]
MAFVRKIRLYDESATVYHRRYREIQGRKYQAVINHLETGPLIDVGIGTGIGLPFIVRFPPVIGVDGSIEMLRIANTEAQELSEQGAMIELVCSSAEALPFRAGVIPTVVSITVLQNLSNIDLGFEELLHVAQINGLVAVTVLAKTLSMNDLKARLNSAVAQLVEFELLANEDVGFIIRVIKKPVYRSSLLRTVNFKDKLTVSRGTLGVEYRGKSAYQNLTKGYK